ncbi:MAG: response regulator transcription factor [Provencibacterium sp.]|jgi:DNA-binding LytR/AlgR family response regulator|nr:response regulator transcription factor [Provencibacterium sp.]
MKIAICEDEWEQARIIDGYLQELKAQYAGIVVKIFPSGEELLGAYRSPRDFDMVYMDIRLKDMDGLETARLLRDRDPDCILVFISSYPEYVFQTFPLSAFHFILKPVQRLPFFEVFERAAAVYRRQHCRYVVKWNGDVTVLEVGEIVYIEGYRRHVIVYTRGGQVYRSVGKLNQEEERLRDYGFLRIHQGFLVNMQYIRSICDRSLELMNGTAIDISVRKKKSVLKQYHQYLLRHSL